MADKLSSWYALYMLLYCNWSFVLLTFPLSSHTAFWGSGSFSNFPFIFIRSILFSDKRKHTAYLNSEPGDNNVVRELWSCFRPQPPVFRSVLETEIICHNLLIKTTASLYSIWSIQCIIASFFKISGRFAFATSVRTMPALLTRKAGQLTSRTMIQSCCLKNTSVPCYRYCV